jgi:riboflavin synthase alpha subunit
MTNTEMKANRFLRLHLARKKIAAIRFHLQAGHTVQITTALKAIRFTKKHTDMFKATKTGAYVQQGKGWACIDGTKINVFA